MTISLTANQLSYQVAHKQIVDHVSITASQGEVVGLFGPNGAGKTTTFHILSGIVQAQQGTIFFGEEDITALPIAKRAKLGLYYLPQDHSVFRDLTVHENLMAAAECRKDLSHAQQVSIVDETLERLKLTHVADSKAKMISGGERRRAEIARILTLSPKMIMLDEPFAGVDPVAVNDIQSIILDLKQQGVGIVITDHNVRETLTFCDRGYVMHQGKMIASGSPETIIHCDKIKSIYLGNTFS